MKKNEWQAGFTLVSVLIAGALASALALYLAQLNTQQMQGQKALEGSAAISQWEREIRVLLAQSDACLNTFSGRNPNEAFSLTELKDSLNRAKWTTDPALATNRSGSAARIQSINVAAWDGESAKMTIVFEKIGKVVGMKTKAVEIGIHYVINGNAIDDCWTITGSGSGLWERAESGIYYEGIAPNSNVGINNNAPTESLDIVGNIKFSNNNVDNIFGLLSSHDTGFSLGVDLLTGNPSAYGPSITMGFEDPKTGGANLALKGRVTTLESVETSIASRQAQLEMENEVVITIGPAGNNQKVIRMPAGIGAININVGGRDLGSIPYGCSFETSEVVAVNGATANLVTASCPADKQVIAGGCLSTAPLFAATLQSYPDGPNYSNWNCLFEGDRSTGRAYANCCYK